jgi:FtsZ-binding cell division protein ZapB
MPDRSLPGWKGKIDALDILKVEVAEFKILDKYIKEENTTLKDRCAQLQREVDRLTTENEKLHKLSEKKHNRLRPSNFIPGI